MVENVTGGGEEERVLGKHCGAHWQERRTAAAAEPQPESDSKLQCIALGVRGTFQTSQRNMAAAFSLRQRKISPHDAANSPSYSLGSLICPLHLAHTHTPLVAQALCVSQETVDKPQLSIS